MRETTYALCKVAIAPTNTITTTTATTSSDLIPTVTAHNPNSS